MKLIGFFSIVVIAAVSTAWGLNAYKLASCDFESPYRCEVIHVIGLIPAASLITVWFESDSK